MTSHDNVTDIVERLRALTKTRNGRGLDPSQYHLTNPDGPEAADTIATLHKQLENARSEALEEAACIADSWGVGHPHISKQIRALKGQP